MLLVIPVIDEILMRHAAALGEDLHRYRNHAYRVANLHWHLQPGSAADLRVLAVAAAFHDLGMWTASTFDYLGPSGQLADNYLRANAMDPLRPLVLAMIENHHKLTRVAPSHAHTVEIFRRADWVDVSGRWRSFGVPAGVHAAIVRTFPSLGFHRALLRIAGSYALRNPLRPLPMFRP